MKRMLQVAAAILMLVVSYPTCTGVVPGTVMAQTQPPKQEDWIPVSELPPQDQLPAAPLLVGAYAFVLVMLFGYVITVSRRLTTIQREVDRLDADLKRSGKG